MAVRRLVAHSNTQDSQWLKIDHNSRYIENHSEEWQFLFGPNSELTNSQQILKIAAEFDKVNLDSIYFTSYLYNQNTGNVDNASSCTLRIYKVTNPNWSESIIYTNSIPALPNQHFYAKVPLASLPGVDFEGGDVILMEAVIVRSGTTYRDRAYVNHLGVYDSIIRLKQDVEWLDLSKLDE
jgi:hypothetical protein